MAAEATANAAVGDPALSSAWTVRPAAVGERFEWRVRLTNGRGGGMGGFPVTATYTTSKQLAVRFTSPLSGTTDANGYFTVSGEMLKEARLTLSVALSAPRGLALMARDPRFNPAATGFSQRLILADTKPLSVSDTLVVRDPDPPVVSRRSPQRRGPGWRMRGRA